MLQINVYKSSNNIINRSILVIVATLGVIFGIGGIGHGFFEALQGYTPTNGLVIDAIGTANRIWEYGKEPAFTVIPNFLITGITAMIVGLAVIVWSVFFLHRKYGSIIFLLLFILLFLVGGGIAQVIFFIIGWLFSTRIHRSLIWWRKVLRTRARKILTRLWLIFLIVSTLLILFVLEIAIFGFIPGISNPDTINTVMLFTLGVGFVFLILAFIAGIANDIEKGVLQNGEKYSSSLCI